MLRDDSSWRFKMPDPANVGDIYNLGLLPYHKRCPMNVHEYQAKAILRDYGVPVPRGHAAFAPEEAVAVAKELGGPITVVKAQIHADAERVASKSAGPVTKAA